MQYALIAYDLQLILALMREQGHPVAAYGRRNDPIASDSS
jgi:hypothetical protein